VALCALLGCSSGGSSTGNTQDGAAPATGGSTGTPGLGGSIGTGGFSAGTGGRTGGAGAPGAGGSGAAGSSGAGGASGGCYAIVSQILPSSPEVESGPTAHVRVQGAAIGAGSSPVMWQWSVLFTDSRTLTTKAVTPNTVMGAVLDFPVLATGSYTVTAQITNPPGCRTGVWTVAAVDPGPMKYLLRASATGFPIQDTEFPLNPSDPQPMAPLALKQGIASNLFPQRTDMNGGPLLSYIRITDMGSGVSVDGDTSRGALMVPLLPTGYEALIVPAETYAPLLLSGLPSMWPQEPQIDRGIAINTTTIDSAGAPVANVRIVARRGALPSTVAESGSNGGGYLYARPGAAPLEVDIVPPFGSGLPNATVGAGNPQTDPGIMLPEGIAWLNMTMRWDHVTMAPMTIHVLAPGGAATGAGARVRATSQAAPGVVGTVTVTAQPPTGTTVTLHATGKTDVEVATDSTGTAAFTALPIGTYTVTVIPVPTAAALSASSLAITSTTVLLATGGFTRDVMLSKKSTLTGTLLPVADSPGAQITAIDHSVPAAGTVVTATVGASGIYQLFVDPGRSYEVLAAPAPSSTRGRAMLWAAVSDNHPALDPATLPVGHAVHGQVTFQGTAVGGTLVQAFCPVSSSRCLDATFPLAETIARSDGKFDLILPDPPAN
jgi:hypothetical protein